MPSSWRSRHRPPRPGRSGAARAIALSSDRPFLALALLNFVLVSSAVALLASLLPVYAHNSVGAAEHTIGLLFLAKSLLIIVLQLPVARAHEGYRRMTGLALTAGLLALAWLLVEATGLGADVAFLLVAVLVFAVGECLYDAIVGPLIADLASDELGGRYLAVNELSCRLGFIAGPGLGGFLLATSTQALWPVAASLCLAAAGGALALEQALPPAVRATPRRQADVSLRLR